MDSGAGAATSMSESVLSSLSESSSISEGREQCESFSIMQDVMMSMSTVSMFSIIS